MEKPGKLNPHLTELKSNEGRNDNVRDTINWRDGLVGVSYIETNSKAV
mgnify:FL=1